MEERVAACKSLSFSGITAEPVYDLIEKNLLGLYAQLPNPRSRRYAPRDVEQELGWCAKALAYSGNEKYRPTLERIAARPERLADHAQAALESLDDYARWNPIINDTSHHRPPQSWAMTRASNMLRSGDPRLEREGLKLAKAVPDDPTPLLDLVEQKLLAGYASPADADQEDIVAWYCRALAHSRNAKYRPTLRTVAERSASEKVRTYATKALGDIARGD